MTPSERQALRELCDAYSRAQVDARAAVPNGRVAVVIAGDALAGAARTALPALLDRVEVLTPLLQSARHYVAELADDDTHPLSTVARDLVTSIDAALKVTP